MSDTRSLITEVVVVYGRHTCVRSRQPNSVCSVSKAGVPNNVWRKVLLGREILQCDEVASGFEKEQPSFCIEKEQ